MRPKGPGLYERFTLPANNRIDAFKPNAETTALAIARQAPRDPNVGPREALRRHLDEEAARMARRLAELRAQEATGCPGWVTTVAKNGVPVEQETAHRCGAAIVANSEYCSGHAKLKQQEPLPPGEYTCAVQSIVKRDIGRGAGGLDAELAIAGEPERTVLDYLSKRNAPAVFVVERKKP
jgi:hypothetical protein